MHFDHLQPDSTAYLCSSLRGGGAVQTPDDEVVSHASAECSIQPRAGTGELPEDAPRPFLRPRYQFQRLHARIYERKDLVHLFLEKISFFTLPAHHTRDLYNYSIHSIDARFNSYVVYTKRKERTMKTIFRNCPISRHELCAWIKKQTEGQWNGKL